MSATIVNKYGIIHTVPDNLIDLVQSMGGRLATPDEIAAYTGGVAPLVDVTPPPRAVDDLTRIKGVGARTADALNAFGVYTFTELITADPVDVAQAIDGASTKQVRGWQAHAADLSAADRGQDA